MKITRLLSILLFTASPVLATEYFASPTGSSGNNGLSTDAPWPLQYAVDNCGASNTITAMSGDYSGQKINVGTYANVTLRSQVKWGARLINSTNYGVNIGGHGITLDGFEIAYAAYGGLTIDRSNCVVKNLWIHHCGTNPPPQTGTGIYAEGNGNIFEANLIENNALPTNTFAHGFYLGNGTNVTIRGNVIRRNAANGIQLWNSSGSGSKNVQIYNNLLYGNGAGEFSCGGEASGLGMTVNLTGNTVKGTNWYLIKASTASGSSVTLTATNNIFVSGGVGDDVVLYVVIGGGDTYSISGGYNLVSRTNSLNSYFFPGILTDYFGFVNTNSGLYWLKDNSPARGVANTIVLGPVDFFGNAQTQVFDIGAFQHTPALASDVRVLDPSPATGANYWQPYSPTTTGQQLSIGTVTIQNLRVQ